MNARSVPTLLALAATVLAALASAAGLLLPDLYRDAPNWVQQARGTDLATLLAVVPILAGGMWAGRRGSAVGHLAALAGLLYLVYNYAIFVFSVHMNALTAVHIAIFGLALWSLILGGRDATVEAAARTVAHRLNQRVSGVLLTAVAALFALLWIAQIAGTSLTGDLPPDLVLAGIATNPVYALDLGFFLPLCAVAGIGLLRGSPAGAYALPMLIWVPLMSAGILGGFVFTAAAGEEVPLAVAIVVGGLGIAGAATAAVPLARHPSRVLRATTA